MKKILSCFFALILLLSMVGCSDNEQPNTTSSYKNNSTVDIDTSSIIRNEKPGFIPVSTDSIKDVLKNTGRFEILEVPQLSGVDVFCGLDKVDGNSIASVNFTISDDATTMVSYNFSKDAVQEQSESSVRWGLDVLLHIFSDSLTDDTWNEILLIASKNESVGSLGTDYDGYSNADTGIKLIYADLGSSVQIDIEPYNDLSAITGTSYSYDTSTQFGWNLLLVNPWNAVPKDYSFTLTELRNGYYVDERIYPSLQNMFDDARSNGVYPLIVSAYRTNQEQQTLYQDKINSYISKGHSESRAISISEGWVAKPGFSEHETGLAVDINAESGNADAVYNWLAANSYKYGFIVRYPTDKSSITGINYEPWHFRYVGEEAAEYIYNNKLTLEEYIEQLNKAEYVEK